MIVENFIYYFFVIKCNVIFQKYHSRLKKYTGSSSLLTPKLTYARRKQDPRQPGNDTKQEYQN